MFNWLRNIFLKKKEIIIIAAIQNDRGIGYKGDLVHSIKNDMKHFIEQTKGHTVIMGRKNWESIPERYRPFKERENIIVTRDSDYSSPGALVVSSLEEAIERSTSEKIYIIGGGQIYALGLRYSDTLDLTIIDSNKPADIYFPEYEELFELINSSEKITDEKTGLNYKFTIWKRK